MLNLGGDNVLAMPFVIKTAVELNKSLNFTLNTPWSLDSLLATDRSVSYNTALNSDTGIAVTQNASLSFNIGFNIDASVLVDDWPEDTSLDTVWTPQARLY